MVQRQRGCRQDRLPRAFSVKHTQPVPQTVAALEEAGVSPGHLSVIYKALWDNKGKKEENGKRECHASGQARHWGVSASWPSTLVRKQEGARTGVAPAPWAQTRAASAT